MDFIVVVFDVGSHVVDGYASLKDGLQTIKAMIENKLFSESKDEISIVLCGAQKTKNSLHNNVSDGYKHIFVWNELQRSSWSFIDELNENNVLFGHQDGDLLEVIIVAADILVQQLRGRKVNGAKRVLVVSNLEKPIDFSQLPQIMIGLREQNIELNIISEREFHHDNVVGLSGDAPSTSDPRAGLKKTAIRSENENQLSKMVTDLKGMTYSYDDVLVTLSIFQSKVTKPNPWKANLEISNVCHIPLVCYWKVRACKPATLKLRYGGAPEMEVERRTTYHLNDGDNTEVDLMDTIKGFKYGKSVVPCTEEDISSMVLSTEKGLRLIGFCEEEQAPHQLYVGDSSHIFLGDPSFPQSAFTALVHAMYERGVVALVRRVFNNRSSPRLGVMVPSIKRQSFSLVYNEIAFGEDIRSLTFPSLPISSFTEDQLKVVDDFIDALMLVRKDGRGGEEELFKPLETSNPSLQSLFHAASHRHDHPHEPLPPLPARVLASLRPPGDAAVLETVLDGLRASFPLVGKETATSGRKKPSKSADQPQEETAKRPRSEPLSVPPADTPSSLLGTQETVWRLLSASYLDTLHPQALSLLQEARNTALAQASLVPPFNALLADLKGRLPRSDPFWTLLRTENVGPIDKLECEGGCTESDRLCFFEVDEKEEALQEPTEEEMDTLFNDM